MCVCVCVFVCVCVSVQVISSLVNNSNKKITTFIIANIVMNTSLRVNPTLDLIQADTALNS